MSRACIPISVDMVSPVSEIWLTFKNSQISLLGYGLYSPWSSKNLIDWNQLKKFMQLGIDVKCMYTNFGGRGLSAFRDKISFWSIVVEIFNQLALAQKIYASRDCCHVQVHSFW